MFSTLSAKKPKNSFYTWYNYLELLQLRPNRSLPYIKRGRSPSLCNTVNYRLQSRSCGEGTEGHLGLRVHRSRQSWPFHESRFLSAGAPHARTAALPPVSRGRRARTHRGRMEPPGGRAEGRAPPPQRCPGQHRCAQRERERENGSQGRGRRCGEGSRAAALLCGGGGRCARRRWGPSAPRPRPR